MKAMDQAAMNSVNSCFSTAKDIAENAFRSPKVQKWEVPAAFTLLVIQCHEVAQFLEKNEMRIQFCDDLPEQRDITDQISKVRNAVCHIRSKLHEVEGAGVSVSFCMMAGHGDFAKIGSHSLCNPYDDDTAFFFGMHRLLLNRHIKRFLADAQDSCRHLARDHSLHWR